MTAVLIPYLTKYVFIDMYLSFKNMLFKKTIFSKKTDKICY